VDRERLAAHLAAVEDDPAAKPEPEPEDLAAVEDGRG
jgi:hypothetical protein